MTDIEAHRRTGVVPFGYFVEFSEGDENDPECDDCYMYGYFEDDEHIEVGFAESFSAALSDLLDFIADEV